MTRQTGITKRTFKGIHGVEKAAEEFICRNSKQMSLLTYSGDHRHIYTVATESAGKRNRNAHGYSANRSGRAVIPLSAGRNWVNGHRGAKTGCMLDDFTPTDVSQLNLFDNIQSRSNSNKPMKVVDGINHSELGKMWFAGRGIAPE